MERDEVFMKKTLAAIRAEKTNAAIVVAGGFHSRGIAELMQERRMPYKSIPPSWTDNGLNCTAAPSRNGEIGQNGFSTSALTAEANWIQAKGGTLDYDQK